MGSLSRIKPEYLAGKLLTVRKRLGLSQSALAEKLSSQTIKLRRSDISRYELGLREPPLVILFRYAQIAGVSMDLFANDEMNISEFEQKLK